MIEKLLFVSIEDTSEESKRELKSFINRLPQESIVNVLNDVDSDPNDSIGDITDLTFVIDSAMTDKVIDLLNSDKKYNGVLNAYVVDVDVDAKDPNDQMIKMVSLFGVNVDGKNGSPIDFDKTKENFDNSFDDYDQTDELSNNSSIEDMFGMYENDHTINENGDVRSESIDDMFGENVESTFPINQNETSPIEHDQSFLIDELLPSVKDIMSEFTDDNFDFEDAYDPIEMLAQLTYESKMDNLRLRFGKDISNISEEQLESNINDFRNAIKSNPIEEVDSFIEAKQVLIKYEQNALEKANEIKESYNKAMDAWIESKKPELMEEFRRKNPDTTDEQLRLWTEKVNNDRETINQQINIIKEDAISKLSSMFMDEYSESLNKNAKEFLSKKKKAELSFEKHLELLKLNNSNSTINQNPQYKPEDLNIQQNNSFNEDFHSEKTELETVEPKVEELQDENFDVVDESLEDDDFINFDEEVQKEMEAILKESESNETNPSSSSISYSVSEVKPDENITEEINDEIITEDINDESLSEEIDDENSNIEWDSEQIDESDDGEYEYVEEDELDDDGEYEYVEEDELDDDGEYEYVEEDELDDDGEYEYVEEDELDDDEYEYIDDESDDDDDDDESDDDKKSDKKKIFMIGGLFLVCMLILFGVYKVSNFTKSNDNKPKSSQTSTSQKTEEKIDESVTKQKDGTYTSKYTKIDQTIKVKKENSDTSFEVTITKINKDGSADGINKEDESDVDENGDPNVYTLPKSMLKQFYDKNNSSSNSSETVESSS